MTQLADRLLGSAKASAFETKSTKDFKKVGKDEIASSKVIPSNPATTPATGLTEGVAKVTPEADEMPLEDKISSSVVKSVAQQGHAGEGVPAGSAAATERLPSVGEQRLCREFIMQGLDGVEITSLDITSHGCYVVAGCGNGMVLVFDLTQKLREPACVGQILAKGLHTNLLMTVKITEDCRYCFAGVTKGSSELLAIDLSRLPVWDEATGFGVCQRRYGFVNKLVTCHSRSDPKLRGFGDAVRVRGDSRTTPTYRLASGLGIKNVHVWQFTPPSAEGEQPSWVCMYDVATNGNTIESIAFRMGGEALLSKSSGANLRVWDLTSYDEGEEPANQTKPRFEDVANTQDSRSLLDEFAFGGTYEFAIVRLNAHKSANRNALEVPVRATDEEGQRRRRMMRQISSISATQDAKHAIVLCADGGCLYYNKSGEGGSERSSLVELPSLPRNMDNLSQCTGRDWTLRRVGYQGEVVLLRASQATAETHARVVVKPIYLENERVAPTLLEKTGDDLGVSLWTEWGYFKNPLAEPPLEASEEEVHYKYSSTSDASNAAGGSAKVAEYEGATTGKKRARKDKASKEKGGEAGEAPDRHKPTSSGRGRPPLVPGSSATGAAKRARSNKEEHGNTLSGAKEHKASAKVAGNEEYKKSLQRPSAAKSSNFGYGYGFGKGGEIPDQEEAAKEAYEDYAFHFEEPKVNYKPIKAGPPPRARRVVEAPFDKHKYLIERPRGGGGEYANVQARQPSVANVVMRRFKSLCKHWIQSQSRRPKGDCDDILKSHGCELGVCTLSKLGEVCTQQDRVRAQFVGEATRAIAKHLNTLNESHGKAFLSVDEMPAQYSSHFLSTPLSQEGGVMGLELPLQAAAVEVEAVIARYQGAVHEMLGRQSLEVGASISLDSLASLAGHGGPLAHPKATVQYRHDDSWEKARSFTRTVRLLVDSVLKQYQVQEAQEVTKEVQEEQVERTEVAGGSSS